MGLVLSQPHTSGSGDDSSQPEEAAAPSRSEYTSFTSLSRTDMTTLLHEEDDSGEDTHKTDPRPMMKKMERRIRLLEDISGITSLRHTTKKFDVVRLNVISTVDAKLARFGLTSGFVIAILVLIGNLVFVIIFTKRTVDRDCRPNFGMIDAAGGGGDDGTAEQYKKVFGDKNVHICSTTMRVNDATWTPCHLAGFTCDNYSKRSDCLEHRCNDDTVCSGLASISYMTCPSVGTTLGAAFGYVFFINIVIMAIVGGLHALCGGRREWKTWKETLSRREVD